MRIKLGEDKEYTTEAKNAKVEEKEARGEKRNGREAQNSSLTFQSYSKNRLLLGKWSIFREN